MRHPALWTWGLTTLAMVAFAGNSLLCRMALRNGAIDPASFTSVRLLGGAVALALLAMARQRPRSSAGSWASAAALFAYAAAFSWAYVNLPAATGALLLFGAVQVTMIGRGLARGERLRRLQWLGLLAALGGLVALLLPGLQAPPWQGALLMVAAGIAWGIYSLRGRGRADPVAETAGNFIRAAPLAVLLSALSFPAAHATPLGLVLAALSGALCSGVGYAVWYSALPGLSATRAAAVQLTVPAIAAVGAVLLLGESLTLRLILSSVVILGGVWCVIALRR